MAWQRDSVIVEITFKLLKLKKVFEIKQNFEAKTSVNTK